MKQLKLGLYFLRRWCMDIVRYPHYRLQKSSQQYDDYWEARRPVRIDDVSPWERARADHIIALLQQRGAVSSIGDIGSGDGALLLYIQNHIHADTVTAYDFSPASLEAARSRGITAVALDARSTEARQSIQPADYLLLLEVLEHIADSEALLRAAYEKATHGVFFSVPNTGFFVHRLRLLFGKFPLQWSVDPGEHLRFWTLRDMRWWLKAQGYTTARVIAYRGVPGLRALLPGLFAEGILVYIPK